MLITEAIITIAILAIVIMAWSKISKSLTWVGSKVESTGDIIDHGIEAAVKQTARAVIISDEALDDTKLGRIKAKSKWLEEYQTASKGLNKGQEAKLTELEKWMNEL